MQLRFTLGVAQRKNMITKQLNSVEKAQRASRLKRLRNRNDHSFNIPVYKFRFSFQKSGRLA